MINKFDFKNSWKYFIRSIGLAMVILFILLVLMIFYSYIYNQVLIIHIQYNNIYFTTFMVILGMYIVLGIIFNFMMSVVLSPGTTADIEDKHNLQQYTASQLDQIKDAGKINICKKCVKEKPYRAHHCSVCGTCVLKMDHHCPWINNCVGYYTQRYFALFLFWLVMGTGYMTMLYGYIYLDEEADFIRKQLKSNLFNFVCPMVVVLFIVLWAFVGWNWFLILTGQTTIEFWGKKLPNSSKSEYNFSSSSMNQNLYQVFGTKNIFQIFLFPSARDMPHDGTNWYQNTAQDSDSEDENLQEEINFEKQQEQKQIFNEDSNKNQITIEEVQKSEDLLEVQEKNVNSDEKLNILIEN